MPHKFTNLSLEGEPLDQLQQVDQSQSDISAEIQRLAHQLLEKEATHDLLLAQFAIQKETLHKLILQLISVAQQRNEFSILNDELSTSNINLEGKADALVIEVKSLKNEKVALLAEKTRLKESALTLQANMKKLVALNRSLAKMPQNDIVMRELDAMKMEKSALIEERDELIKEMSKLKLEGKQMAVVNQHLRTNTILLTADLQRAQSRDTQRQ